MGANQIVVRPEATAWGRGHRQRDYGCEDPDWIGDVALADAAMILAGPGATLRTGVGT